MEDSSVLTIDDCTFDTNVAVNGGGLNIFDSSSMAMTNSTFVDNDASGYGGGSVLRRRVDHGLRHHFFGR